MENHPKNLWKNVGNHYLCIAKYTDYEILAKKNRQLSSRVEKT